jgi:hypothetical protein
MFADEGTETIVVLLESFSFLLKSNALGKHSVTRFLVLLCLPRLIVESFLSLDDVVDILLLRLDGSLGSLNIELQIIGLPVGVSKLTLLAHDSISLFVLSSREA